jgi:hypothetical protein
MVDTVSDGAEHVVVGVHESQGPTMKTADSRGRGVIGMA